MTVDIESTDSNELSITAKNVKGLYNEFSNDNIKLVQYCIDHGATSEADEHRKARSHLKAEVKQLISLVNSKLDSIHNISFQTTSTIDDNFDDTIVKNTAALNVSGHHDHPLVGVKYKSNPPFRTSSPVMSGLQRDDAHLGFTTSTVASCFPIPGVEKSSFHPFNGLDSNEIFSAVSTSSFFGPSIASEISHSYTWSQPTPTVTLTRPSAIPHFSAQVRPTPTVGSSLQPNSCLPNIPPFSKARTATVGSFPPRFSAAGIPPNLGTQFCNYRPQFQPNAIPNASGPQPQVNNNAIADILNAQMKNQLFQKFGEPFNGDPHRYHAWVSVIQHKTSGFTLDPWDVLTILHTNSVGKPRKMIEDAMNIGAANPELTLNNLWRSLYDHFGTGSHIASALINKLDAFPLIKTMHHSDKLGELIHICNLISVNMNVAEELQLFNLFGSKKFIWAKFGSNCPIPCKIVGVLTLPITRVILGGPRICFLSYVFLKEGMLS